MAISYVKFTRGTQALYDQSSKDQDTLYFIYENPTDTTGKLYLGNKLIGGGSSGLSETIFVSDIEDILIKEGLADRDILAYNDYTKKWENISIDNLVTTMVGATAQDDGVAGLVPVPSAGDQLKFLRGDGTWTTVDGTLSQAEIQSINEFKSQVATLIGEDSEKSVAEIVQQEVAKLLIPENAKESLDSLQEIADWIQDHPDDAAAINSSITILQTKVETLENQNLDSRISTIEDSIGTFTPVENKYLTIGSAISYLDSNVTQLAGSVTELNERLRWHELTGE